MLDFVSFINQKSELSDIAQTTLLDDFCAFTGWIDDPENPVTKQEYMNQQIQTYIEQTVNAQRTKAAMDAIEIMPVVLVKAKVSI